MEGNVQPLRKRLAGGVLTGEVTIGYQDDWQREGLIDAPAVVVWFFELIEDSCAAHAQTTFLRWIRLDGRWQFVPYLDSMLDASFTGMMVEASRRADESAARRYSSFMRSRGEQASAHRPH